jgi:large subunit ribosomal protein L4
MANISVINQEGEKADSLKLNTKVFDGSVNKPLLQQVITMYLANQREGNAQTKTRKEVRGGGKKPWRQKGTGRARVGSIRSPLWRGGGVTFGPQPKDWNYQLPRKMRKSALSSSLNAKLNENNITVVDELKLQTHKTKELTDILKKLKLNEKKLIIVKHQPDDNIKRAARNIRGVSLSRAKDINAYQILVSEGVLVEKQALEEIAKDLSAFVKK